MRFSRLASFSGTLLIVTSTLTHAQPAPADGLPRVRAHDPAVAAALTRGYDSSRTFRALVDRLRWSNVIVHVERREMRGRCAGATRFVTMAGGFRFVRIEVDWQPSSDGLVALLGHELRHVVEVADATWVVDQGGYRTLYEHIGRPSAACRAPGACFDTVAAVDSGHRVRRELRLVRRTRKNTRYGHPIRRPVVQLTPE